MKKSVRCRRRFNKFFHFNVLLLTCVVILFVAVCSSSFAQGGNRISGTVTGQNNEPLSGVSVTIQGTSVGTATDNSGAFSITAGNGKTLVFSYVGFRDTTIAISDQTTINVRMTPA